MKLVGVSLVAAATAGFMLMNTAPGKAASTAYYCKKAAECSQRAQNERYDPDNPGMGSAFKATKKECQMWSKKCSEGR